ncbi:MAG: hypothetical protein NUV51_05380, partial [Sulfuricaulis sp.]|nr:hypothetical protein [Sulfuricaulis sp.]
VTDPTSDFFREKTAPYERRAVEFASGAAQPLAAVAKTFTGQGQGADEFGADMRRRVYPDLYPRESEPSFIEKATEFGGQMVGSAVPGGAAFKAAGPLGKLAGKVGGKVAQRVAEGAGTGVGYEMLTRGRETTPKDVGMQALLGGALGGAIGGVEKAASTKVLRRGGKTKEPPVLYYRGTRDSKTKSTRGTFFTQNAKIASIYGEVSGNIIDISSKRIVDFRDPSTFSSILKKSKIPRKDHQEVTDLNSTGHLWMSAKGKTFENALLMEADRAGWDGVRLNDSHAGIADLSTVIFDRAIKQVKPIKDFIPGQTALADARGAKAAVEESVTLLRRGGEKVGAVAKKVEQKVESVPVVGDIYKGFK